MQSNTEQLVAGTLAYAKADGLKETEFFTADYWLTFGFPLQDIESNGRALYCVVNRSTGVIEVVEAVLPNAVQVMEALQAALDAVRKDRANKAFASAKRPIVTN